VSQENAPDQYGDEGDAELPEEFLIGAQAEIALLDHLDIVICKAEQKMTEEDEECEQCRYREWCKEECRCGHGKHDHDTAHRGRPTLLPMTRRSLLTDALSVFQSVQEREEVDAAEKHDSK